MGSAACAPIPAVWTRRWSGAAEFTVNGASAMVRVLSVTVAGTTRVPRAESREALSGPGSVSRSAMYVSSGLCHLIVDPVPQAGAQ
ncbi:hypothetical protein [Streptomyces sp. NPDC052042]|uniref:hypothetical protein n=1 Tax=Streptomyces sp. NPDC052042 TaxID=3365683 RepID=UPI0037D6693B